MGERGARAVGLRARRQGRERIESKGGTLPVGVMADKKAGHRELRLRVVVTNVTTVTDGLGPDRLAVARGDWREGRPSRERGWTRELEILSCSSSSGLP